jgi:hypothetical protein
MKQHFADAANDSIRNRISAWMLVAVLFVTVIAPLMVLGHASAAPQLTPRNAAIDKSYINATDVQFNFSYTLSDTTAKKQPKVMPIAMDIVHRNRL